MPFDMSYSDFIKAQLTKKEIEAYKQFAIRTNAAWGEANERARRERVAAALGFPKDEPKKEGNETKKAKHQKCKS